MGIHFEKVFLCGKVCEQALIQAVAFVQGFLLGKVVSSCVHTSGVCDRSPSWQSNISSNINPLVHAHISTVHNNDVCMQKGVKEEPALLTPCIDSYTADEPSVYFDDFDQGKSEPASVNDSSNPQCIAPISRKRLRSGKYEPSVRPLAKKRKTRIKVIHKKRQPKPKSEKRQPSKPKPAVGRRKRKKRDEEEAQLYEEGSEMPQLEESCSRGLDDSFDMEMNDSAYREWEVSCPDCGKGFKNTKTMKAHVRVKHQNNVKICRVCDQKCYGQIGLSLHMKSKHAGEKANECDICQERFPYSTDLERHVTLVHGKDRFICHICGKHFRYWHTLQSHVKAHSGVRAYVCEHCGKGFLRGNTLIDHKKSHFCRVCKKKLMSGQCPDHPKPRYTHNYQSGLSLLQCKECSMTFDSIDALENHVKTHEMQRPFHCQVCGKGFHTSQHLYKHSKQHEEKQFQCGICAKKFTYKCNMQKHQETHAEDRPFSCEFCNHTFKNKRALETHLPRHIEERQFKCHICGKGLTRRAKLKEHLLKMHPVT